MPLTFGKEYKLCSKRIIDAVFDQGEQVKAYPYIARYLITGLPEPVAFQVVFSAPKRTFRKAHERNRIKRLARETFRLNKSELEMYLKNQNKQLALFLVYTAPKEVSFAENQKAMSKLQKKIIDTIDAL